MDLSKNHQNRQRSVGYMESPACLSKRHGQGVRGAPMPLPGKVLHLYVEVMSVSEEDDQFLGRGDGGQDQLMLPGPDLVSKSQRSSNQSSPNRSPDLSPVMPHRSKLSSGHSVSFQLQNPDCSCPPAQFQCQKALDDGFNQLLEALAPSRSTTSLGGSVGGTHHPDMGPYYGTGSSSQSLSSSQWLSVPSGPTVRPSSCEVPGMVDEDGRTSLVSFGYIEKGSVNGVAGRMSDPMWYSDETSSDNTLHSHPHQPRRDSSWRQPYLSRAAMDAVAREATHRALEEFGSPELRRRFAGSKNHSPSLPRRSQGQRCRSLGGSPVLSRSTLTLPSRTELLEMDGRFNHGSMNGLPRSPASDRLCAQTSDSLYSTTRPHGPIQSPRRSWVHEDSSRLSHKFHPPLPAGRPTDIQHEVPGCCEKQPGTSYLDDNPSHHGASPVGFSDHSNNRSPYHLSRCSSRTSDANSPISDRRSISPYSISDLDCKAFGESNLISAGCADGRFRWTPSPTPSEGESLRSESPKPSGTFQRESILWKPPTETKHQKPQTPATQMKPGHVSLGASNKRVPCAAASPACSSRSDQMSASGYQLRRTSCPSRELSTLHFDQPAQSTGDHKLDVQEQWQHVFLPGGSPAPNPDVPRRNTSSPLESWTATGATVHQSSFRGHTRGNVDAFRVQKQLAQECQLSALGMSKTHSGHVGTLSLGSPSSQSSHGTADGGSGMQLDRTAPVSPTPRSQKIARAKWEFLFGGPTALGPRSYDVWSSPPQTTSSTPQPSNKGRGREQKLSHHQVAPRPRGPAPKTDVGQQSIKYSETDLDTVPLRCYQETDLDEVMRAEAEAAEEAVPALSRKSCLSSDPAGRGEQNGQEDEEEEEEDEEEEVASWASVRMLGDRRRQRAAREEEEAFGLLLAGRTTDPAVHGGPKLPMPVSGDPRRPSESNLDSFSRQFESIMESHRAKGTSYSSLDSVDLLTSGSTSVFTFDLPTLTPEIQSQICESAKQILELSFAPLTRADPAGCPETSHSETVLAAAGAGLRGGSEDDRGPPVRSRSEKESWRRSIVRESFRKATSVPALHSRERSADRPPELLYPHADVAERLALHGSDEVLTNGLKPDLQAAKRLAKRLYNLDSFRKSDVAPHLSKNNNFSQMVAQEYLGHFNFSGMNIDQALRTFLTRFALMGETQERERVLAHFSKRYRQCNPDGLSTEDGVHTLTCAVMLLNSDLHGNNVGKRMSCSQFISNLEGLNDGKDFPKDLLKTLYSSIKNEKLQWTIDEEELRKSVSELTDVRTDSASHTMRRVGSGGNPLVGVAQQADGELYMGGFLVRKVHADPDGKRTPRGKRGWKTLYAALRGLVLYLQKDEYRVERELTEEDVKNAVSIHHSLAMRAADYSKRPNVFYLRTADWRVFLFQAPNGEQMQSWITRINVVAAMFSAPPLPAAIGSQKRFSRPLLPGSNTKLSQEEQLQSHENRFRSVSSELAELTASPQERKVKGRELEEQKLRTEFLEFEKTRYGTYAMLLRAKLANGEDDLAAFEARLSAGGLQRARSSPSLPQDGAPREKPRVAKSLKGAGTNNGGGNKKKAELQRQGSKQEQAA